ncbi:MAG TPA: KTSC domain-containing protein [Pyrinomonadaceae bacterium]|nr:KTSC domain-containing protein [Pyrinomonadaceae bacterium]
MSASKKINSSNLEAAAYDEETKALIIEFKNGSKYKYPEFPLNLWTDFEATFSGEDGKSAGKFFFAKIRHLPCEQVEE